MNGIKVFLVEEDESLFEKLSFSLKKAGFCVGLGCHPLDEDFLAYRKCFVIGSARQLAGIKEISKFPIEVIHSGDWTILQVEKGTSTRFDVTVYDAKLSTPFTPRQLILSLISLAQGPS